MTLLEVVVVLIGLLVAVVGGACGYRAFGPVGGMGVILLPLSIWLVGSIVFSIDARRRTPSPIPPARVVT